MRKKSAAKVPNLLTPEHEMVNADQLSMHPKNINESDEGKIHTSMDENDGFWGSLIVQKSTGHIIAGNHRFKVAYEKGMREFPVDWADVDDDTAIRIMLADNASQRAGMDNPAKLAELLKELLDTPRGLLGTLHSADDLDQLLKDLGEPPAGGLLPGADPDEIPEAVETRCKLGDLWRLGDHRLLCGDCTDAASVERLMGGDKADAMWTAPPYGVSYGDKNKYLNKYADKGSKAQWASQSETPIEGDDLDEEGLKELLDAAFAVALSVSKPGAAWYVAAPPGPLHTIFALALQKIGVLRHTLIWKKNNFVLGRCDYHFAHESVYYGWNPAGPHVWLGDRSQSSVFEIDKPRKADLHPSMKPVLLVQSMLKNSCPVGGLVYEPFAGSGTTLIAAESLGMKCMAVELSETYAGIILSRFELLTGKTAELIEGGK